MYSCSGVNILGQSYSIKFNNQEDYDKWHKEKETEKLIWLEYAKQNPKEKIKRNFHGRCNYCVTPIRYGIGICLGCDIIDNQKGKDLCIMDIPKTRDWSKTFDEIYSIDYIQNEENSQSIQSHENQILSMLKIKI